MRLGRMTVKKRPVDEKVKPRDLARPANALSAGAIAFLVVGAAMMIATRDPLWLLLLIPGMTLFISFIVLVWWDLQSGFRARRRLRSYLAANPGALEPGLRLVERDLRTEVNGRIDLLFRDRRGNYVLAFVVDGDEYGDGRAVGQMLACIAWVKERYRRRARGIILAREPSDELLYAAREAGIEVRGWERYELVERSGRSSGVKTGKRRWGSGF